MSLFVALLLLSDTSVELDPAWQPVADPAALMTGSVIHCMEPDPVRRTCLSMAWYSKTPDGQLRYRMVHALSNQLGLAVQTTGTLHWEDGAVCFKVDESTVDSAHLVWLSAPHARVTDRRYFLYFKEEVMQALANRSLCGRAYRHRDTGAYLSVGTVDGEFAGGLMQSFSLIDAKSGYRLRAAND